MGAPRCSSRGRDGSRWAAAGLALAGLVVGAHADGSDGTGSAAGEAGSRALVLRGVAVVDVERGETQEGQTVVIEGGRIRSVGPAAEIAVPDGARVESGEGRYLMPGLWDMHAHVLADWENAFALFLANGVTGVRNLHGTLDDPLGRALELKAALAAGEIRGPLLVANGPIVDGAPPIWRSSVVVTTAEEGRAAVRQLAGRGADLIKVYNRLSREAYFAILDEAREVGIPVDGHVPIDVTMAEASAAGQRSVEHVSFLTEACVPRELEVRALLGEFFAALQQGDPGAFDIAERYARIQVDEHDAERRDELFGVLVANGTWLCPTLVLRRTLMRRTDPAHGPANPCLAFVGPRVREAWQADYERALAEKDLPGGSAGAAAALYDLSKQVVLEGQRAGVGLLAGTDVGNPFLVPGFSLLDELALLVEAGLSPAEALRSATLAPARCLGRGDVGLVEAGRRADLVLLDGDPLEDISATRRIRAVILGGEWLDREELDRMLEGVRERVGRD